MSDGGVIGVIGLLAVAFMALGVGGIVVCHRNEQPGFDAKGRITGWGIGNCASWISVGLSALCLLLMVGAGVMIRTGS